MELVTWLLFSSYIAVAICSCMAYQYYLDLYRIHSDQILLLVKQLILAAGACYMENHSPEMGLLTIRAAEALMARKRIVKYCECDYHRMIPVFEQRIRDNLNQNGRVVAVYNDSDM